MESNMINRGAHVFGDDGVKIGTVRRLISGAPEPIPSPGTEDGGGGQTSRSVAGLDDETGGVQGEPSVFVMGGAPSVDAGAASAGMNSGAGGLSPGLTESGLDFSAPARGHGMALGPSDTKYIEVHHGGHFGRGGDSIWVPFGAIRLLESNGSIVLRYTAQDAASLFSRHPDPLD